MQAMHNIFNIFQWDNPLLAEHAGMGDRTPDILMVQTLVELNRRCELFNKFISGLGKSSTP